MKIKKSQRLFQQSQKIFPGGVNSPVRAFRSVGGEPRFIQKAKGALLYDVDGNSYIDYVGSWGPLVMGHAHPQVVSALKKAAALGTSYGAPSEQESILGALIQKHYPSCEKIRLVNSGTEAVMGAIRLARAFTGREKIIKFEGCYHGHSDSLLVKAGSGALTFGVPTSKGVPEAFARLTLTAPYNDLDAVEKLFKANPQEIACIILEPVVGNSGCILPEAGFLEALRALTQKEGALLIFDEVMTGFRVALGGAQAHFKIRPDLTTLGKVIGGGLPVGAFGGRAEIMDLLAPLGPVYQAGTLSGNPLAMVAGIETLRLITQKANFKKMEKNTRNLAEGIQKIAKASGIPLQVPYIGGMMGLFFSETPVRNLEDAQKSDVPRFNRFFNAMLEQGIYLPPSAYEAWFVSAIHKEKEIEKTLQAVKNAL
ncbi:MAG: glutamate-1-semialdehyde 2,1-aminomutase [Deltaproteobacteria bacterium]|nr:glutamate-1-semialdehyde 2,1-aminomutase [Deltaproteobacteria bacterium]